jgi:hypothetical protein
VQPNIMGQQQSMCTTLGLKLGPLAAGTCQKLRKVPAAHTSTTRLLYAATQTRLGMLAPSRHAVPGIVCPGPLIQLLRSQAQVLSHSPTVAVIGMIMAMIMVMIIPIKICEGQYCMLWAICCSLSALHWLA